MTYTSTNYDIIFIGAGISSLMSAYRLLESNPKLKILILEKGNNIEKRNCPIINNEIDHCCKCSPCSIMEGVGGCGAFSDGKYIITTEYGGWITDIISPDISLNYMEDADQILQSFGANEYRFRPDDTLKKFCLQNGLYMSQAQVKHLGTDNNLSTMKNLVQYLTSRCTIITNINVFDVNKESNIVLAYKDNNTVTFTSKNIVFAVGRSGISFLAKWCKENDIPLYNNPVDLGVRVELPAIIWEDFSKKIYEPKIKYRSKLYGDITRMFCFNDRGSVVTENTDGIITVNGHSFKNEDKKTLNSNFALLSTIDFDNSFDDPIKYTRNIAELSNLISGGNIIVQRFGDLVKGIRTNSKRLKESSTIPTLKAAIPGDLSLCIPKRQLDNIIETLYALDKIAPGTANYDTLLYGVECKYYSCRPKMNNLELINCNNIFAIGDGAGITRSLAQAAACGLYLANTLLNK